MTDYYLRTTDQAEFEQLMIDTGLGVMSEDDVQPASVAVCIDRIGPIVKFDTSTEPPTEIVHTEYHVNLRGTFTDEQTAALEPMCVYPPVPYRVWADDPNALTQEDVALRNEEYANSLLASAPVADGALDEGGLV